VRLLVVEDDPDLNRQLTTALTDAGYVVDRAFDGEGGHFLGDSEPYDAVILDIGLPKMDGISVLEAWRRAGRAMPVLILTARDRWSDKVQGFDAGADDYVAKPFHLEEVLARIRALLRRARLLSEPGEAGGFERGRLKMDFGTYEAFIDGSRLEMTLREFELLRFFVQHPLRVYTREQLLDLVWGRDTFVEPRTVDVHVRRLRRHIERDDANPELILTVRSVGYRFNPETLG
jgi:two-component system, OmpR family, response regulator